VLALPKVTRTTGKQRNLNMKRRDNLTMPNIRILIIFFVQKKDNSAMYTSFSDHEYFIPSILSNLSSKLTYKTLEL
jgi:hypothetical protein